MPTPESILKELYKDPNHPGRRVKLEAQGIKPVMLKRINLINDLVQRQAFGDTPDVPFKKGGPDEKAQSVSECLLLYFEQALHHYLSNISSPPNRAEQLLIEARNVIHGFHQLSMYQKSTLGRKNITLFVEKLKAWREAVLSNPALVSDVGKTQDLLKSMHAALTLVVPRLEAVTIFGMSMFQTQLDEIKNQEKGLLLQIMELSHILSIGQKGKPEHPAVEELNVLTTEWDTSIESLQALLQLKKEEDALQERHQAAISILTAYEANEAKDTGRLYVLEFINENREAFDVLLDDLDEETENDWNVRMKQLQEPTTVQYFIKNGLYALTWLSSPLVSLVRVLEKEGYLPTTYDRESKHKLKQLAETVIGASNHLKQKQQLILNNLSVSKRTAVESFSTEKLESYIASCHEGRQSIASVKAAIIEAEAPQNSGIFRRFIQYCKAYFRPNSFPNKSEHEQRDIIGRIKTMATALINYLKSKIWAGQHYNNSGAVSDFTKKKPSAEPDRNPKKKSKSGGPKGPR